MPRGGISRAKVYVGNWYAGGPQWLNLLQSARKRGEVPVEWQVAHGDERS